MRAELLYEAALTEFLQQESEHLATNVSERSTCARLGIYLEEQLRKAHFTEYYADTEYNRKQRGRIKTTIDDKAVVMNVTVDLVVHSRGEQLPPKDNLIAIEAKKSSQPEESKENDRRRLKALTTPLDRGVWVEGNDHPEHVCGYRVGIFMEIDIENGEIRSEFFKQGERTKSKIHSFFSGSEKSNKSENLTADRL